MLNTTELEKIARLKRLSLTNTEKDYLQEAILFVLYSSITDELVFKGGTCLYKLYKLDRFSEDLDFTLNSNIKIKGIIDEVINDLMLINIHARIKEIMKYRNAINVRLLIKGPFYKGRKEQLCFIPLNISLKEKLTSNILRESIIPIYKDIPTYEVFAMNRYEIFAEKVRAILTRNKPRDLYDLYFLIKQGEKFSLQLINKKLEIYNKKFNLKEFKDKLNEKKGLWQIDLRDLIIGQLPDFSEVKGYILNSIKNV